ncbi:restriction endonuclease [Longimicrobium sp.]|uniref:restriction endonuclease n=1 Tax=Longimicrobium sp. TaxID=2029185 RepID=UPI002EDAC404
MQNLKPWQEFEIAIVHLLRAAGMSVERNRLVNHQQVDVLAEKREWGAVRRIAVECKAYSAELSKDEVSKVVVKYLSLYESRDIDEFLLITLNGVSAGAKSFVEAKRGFRHMTFSELQASILDFTSYIGSIESSYATDGIASYYVPMDAHLLPGAEDDSFDLFDYVLRWLEGKNPAPPLALLSSYGMGKTTFAKHLAFSIAMKWRIDPLSRIPILVDLGRISDEQSLDGLLGKLLTSDHRVLNYTFDLFMELNRSGRFVIIFDSFDEMKHGITMSAFLRNMDEIKRLAVGDARLLICGRPSAFMTNDERRGVLYDQHRIGEDWIHYSTFGGFTELALQPLSNAKVNEFLRKYLGHLQENSTIAERAAKKILHQLSGEFSESLYNLARRPVQLRMLATVLPQWNKPLDKLSRTLLYDHFVDQLVMREGKKPTRGGVSVADRRLFASELAWYLWTHSGKDFTRADDIPDSVFRVVNARDLKKSDVLRRELIVSSALDVKPPDLLYFPHRSIQEFLVAEAIIRALGRRPPPSVPELTSALTIEVREFLQNMISEHALERWISDLDAYRGTLGIQIECLVAAFPNLLTRQIRRIWTEADLESPWPGLFLLREQMATTTRESGVRTLQHLTNVSDEAYSVYAAHLMFIRHVHRDRHTGQTSINVGLFLRDLEFMRTHLTKRYQRKAAEIIGSLALYTKSQTAETGTVRSLLADHYTAGSHLGSMLEGGHLKHPFIFPASIQLRHEDFDYLSSLIEDIRQIGTGPVSSDALPRRGSRRS